jgi:hypothetical protein
MRPSRLFTLVSALSLAACFAAEPQPITSVAIFKVKPGSRSAWFKGVQETYGSALSKLLADGSIMAYGIDADHLHKAGEPDISVWVMYPDFSAYDKVEAAFEKLEDTVGPQIRQLMEMTEPDKHRDLLFRSVVSRWKAPPAGARPYTTVSFASLKPGKGEDYRAHFDKYTRPVLDRLLEEGAIHSYDLMVEYVHTAAPTSRWTVITMPNMAAIDKIEAAFRAANEKLPDEERKAMQARFQELMEPGTHRDSLMRAVVFAAK